MSIVSDGEIGKKRIEVKPIKDDKTEVQVTRKEKVTGDTTIRVGHLKNKLYKIIIIVKVKR